MRRIAVHVHVNSSHFAELVAGQELRRVLDMTGGAVLMSDLDGSARRILICGPHPFGVVHRKRHRLFLIDVFPGVERGDKVFTMQVLRRSDQNGVNRFVFEQVLVIEIGLSTRNDLLRVFEAAGIDVRESHELRIRSGNRVADDFHAARTGADDSQANAIVRAENAGGRRNGCDSGRNLSKKMTTGVHRDTI